MNAELLNCVGQKILNPGNIGLCGFSFRRNAFDFRSSIKNKSREFSLDSNFFNEYGKIISSIGAGKPLLIFQPYIGSTFLEISVSGEDFLQLDTQFTHPLIIKQIPFKVHAECINNKSLLSIEMIKDFSYSKMKGSIFAKYGKSLDFDVNVAFPYNENRFLITSSQILFNSSLGFLNSRIDAFPNHIKFLSNRLSSFFITYQFLNDYLISNHKIGCYFGSKQKLNLISILYDINQKELSLKAEANLNQRLYFASSTNMKLENQKQPNVKNLQIGASFLPYDRYNSKYNLQLTFPDYKVIAKLNAKFRQTFDIDFSAAYNFTTKSFDFGINLLCDSYI